MSQNHYCLNKEEITNLICNLFDLATIDDNDLMVRIENAKNWYQSLGSINYLYAFVIEKRLHDDNNCKDIVDFYYELQEKMFLIIHELDEYFIDFLMKNCISQEMSLEENLISFYNKYEERKF